MVLKLTTKGGDKTRPPLIDELLNELPERARWLDLPLTRVKELHAKATRIHKDTHAPFKNTFIKLLTDATHSTRPTKPPKTQQELDDENEALYQAQQRADEERRRKREAQNHPSPGGGGSGASGDQPCSEGRGGR